MDCSAFGRVLEHDRSGRRVAVNREVEAAVELYALAVRAIELGDCLAAFDAAGGARDGDDVVDHDVLGQDVEEVPLRASRMAMAVCS